LREKGHYRSRLRIMVDILSVIAQEGGSARPTRILYGANLSHDRLVRYLSEMEARGLIRAVQEEEHVRYELTEKGLRLLREIKKVEEFLRAFGLEI